MRLISTLVFALPAVACNARGRHAGWRSRDCTALHAYGLDILIPGDTHQGCLRHEAGGHMHEEKRRDRWFFPFESRWRALTPSLAAGLASGLGIDFHPYGDMRYCHYRQNLPRGLPRRGFKNRLIL